MNKITVVDKDFFKNHSYEDDIIRNILKERVLSSLNDNGFDPENLLFTKKMTFKMIRKFNMALKKTSKHIPILMHEILLLLEGDYTTINFLIMILNDRNKQIIKNECKDKYNINDDECILFEILS